MEIKLLHHVGGNKDASIRLRTIGFFKRYIAFREQEIINVLRFSWKQNLNSRLISIRFFFEALQDQYFWGVHKLRRTHEIVQNSFLHTIYPPTNPATQKHGWSIAKAFEFNEVQYFVIFCEKFTRYFVFMKNSNQ